MRNMKKLLALVLALVMVISLVACKEDATDTPTPEDSAPLGEAIVTNNNTLEHTKELDTTETAVTGLYKDLGEGLTTEELNTKYLEYVAAVKDRLASEGLFTELYDDTNSDNYRSLQAYDATTRYVYNLFCHVDGYQGVRMAVTLYKVEHDDWDNYDWDALLEQLSYYTGLVVNRADLDAAMDEILERAEEGKGFQVYVESQKGDRSVNLSVMEYGTQYECWTIDVFNLVTPGANFYASAEEETPVDDDTSDTPTIEDATPQE